MKKIQNVELRSRLSDIWCQLLSPAEPIPPAAYLLDYRRQNACRMLTSGEDSITQNGHVCGPGSSSYFGKTFRTRFGCTPLEIADPGDC